MEAGGLFLFLVEQSKKDYKDKIKDLLIAENKCPVTELACFLHVEGLDSESQWEHRG